MFTNEIVVTDTLYTQVGDETIETWWKWPQACTTPPTW